MVTVNGTQGGITGFQTVAPGSAGFTGFSKSDACNPDLFTLSWIILLIEML